MPFHHGQVMPLSAFHDAILAAPQLCADGARSGAQPAQPAACRRSGPETRCCASICAAQLRPAGRARPAACLPRRSHATGSIRATSSVELSGLAEAGADAAAAAFAALRDRGIRIAVLEQGNGPAQACCRIRRLPISSASMAAGFAPSPARPRPPGFSRRWSAPIDRAVPRSWSTGLRPRRHCASPSIRGPIFSAARCSPRQRSPARRFPASRWRSKRCLRSGASSRLFRLDASHQGR